MTNEGITPTDLSKQELASDTSEFKASFKPGKIKPTTNSGVRLGMSSSEVQRILGTPKRSFHSRRFNAYELIYSRETAKDNEGISKRFSNYYLFRKDRLYYMELSVNTIGGG